MSWKRPRSPVTIQVGPAGRDRRADAGGDQAVDAVGAAIGEEDDIGVAAGHERLLVADRHARGGVDELAVGERIAERGEEAGLARLVQRFELGRDRRLRPHPPRVSQDVAPVRRRLEAATGHERLAERLRGRRGRSRRRFASARSSRGRGRRRAAPRRVERRTATGAAACRSASRRSADDEIRLQRRPGAAGRSARSAETTCDRS